MALVSDVLEHIQPLNFANMKTQKLKLVRNTTPDNQRVLNFMRNPYCMHGVYSCLTLSALTIALVIAIINKNMRQFGIAHEM